MTSSRETWGDCIVADRLFDQADVTFDESQRPQCEQSRAGRKRNGEPASGADSQD